MKKRKYIEKGIFGLPLIIDNAVEIGDWITVGSTNSDFIDGKRYLVKDISFSSWSDGEDTFTNYFCLVEGESGKLYRIPLDEYLRFSVKNVAIFSSDTYFNYVNENSEKEVIKNTNPYELFLDIRMLERQGWRLHPIGILYDKENEKHCSAILVKNGMTTIQQIESDIYYIKQEIKKAEENCYHNEIPMLELELKEKENQLEKLNESNKTH